MKTTTPPNLYQFDWGWALYKAITADNALPISAEWEADGYKFLLADNGYTYYVKINDWANVNRFPTILEGLQLAHPFEVAYALTDKFDAPRSYRGTHEGLDFDVLEATNDSNQPVLCILGGVASVYHTDKGYGKYVRVDSTHNGESIQLWYAHLDKTYVANGQRVEVGQHLGEIGTTGNVTGEHLHLTLSIPVMGDNGYVVNGVVDPSPFLPVYPELQKPIYPPKPKDTINVWDYFNGRPEFQWINRTFTEANGHESNERYRHWKHDNAVIIQKNGLYEKWRLSADGLIHLDEDISPDVGTQNIPRFYRVTGGAWCKAKMEVGETYNDGGHRVQFYSKQHCHELSEHSGYAGNNNTLYKYHETYTFNRYGQNITLSNVIEIGKSDGEYHYFANDEKRGVIGRVGWVSPWGYTEITEIIPVGSQTYLSLDLPKCLR